MVPGVYKGWSRGGITIENAGSFTVLLPLAEGREAHEKPCVVNVEVGSINCRYNLYGHPHL